MVKYSYDAFWKAFIFSTIIFIFGLNMGSFIENSTLDKLEKNVINSEVELYDSNIRSNVLEYYNISCEKSIENTFEIADKIYEEVKMLEELDKSSTIVEGFDEVHKRYDLLRTQLWLDATNLKTNCQDNFNLIVYIYEYNSKKPQVISIQNLYEELTSEIKSNYESEVLLIPIANNMELNSLELLLENYNSVNQTSIIINNKYIIKGASNYEEIASYLN